MQSGQPLDMGILPGLEKPLNAALSGEVDPERIFVTLEPHERFYFAVPYLEEASQEVLGAAIVYIEHLPTANDVPATILTLLGRSVSDPAAGRRSGRYSLWRHDSQRHGLTLRASFPSDRCLEPG